MSEKTPAIQALNRQARMAGCSRPSSDRTFIVVPGSGADIVRSSPGSFRSCEWLDSQPHPFVRTILKASGACEAVASLRFVVCAPVTHARADEFRTNHEPQPAPKNPTAHGEFPLDDCGFGQDLFGRLTCPRQ